MYKGGGGGLWVDLKKTSGADVSSSKKNNQKNLRGVAITSIPPPPLYVQGLNEKTYPEYQ